MTVLTLACLFQIRAEKPYYNPNPELDSLVSTIGCLRALTTPGRGRGACARGGAGRGGRQLCRVVLGAYRSSSAAASVYFGRGSTTSDCQPAQRCQTDRNDDCRRPRRRKNRTVPPPTTHGAPGTVHRSGEAAHSWPALCHAAGCWVLADGCWVLGAGRWVRVRWARAGDRD